MSLYWCWTLVIVVSSLVIFILCSPITAYCVCLFLFCIYLFSYLMLQRSYKNSIILFTSYQSSHNFHSKYRNHSWLVYSYVRLSKVNDHWLLEVTSKWHTQSFSPSPCLTDMIHIIIFVFIILCFV